MSAGKTDKRCLGCQFRENDKYTWKWPTNSWNRSMKELKRQKPMEEHCWKFCLCKAAVCRKRRRRRSYMSTDRRETAWLTGAFLQLYFGKRWLW